MTTLLLWLLAAAADTPAPTAPKSFADAIQGAKTSTGLFTIHQTETKTLLEIRPEQFGKPFLFFTTQETGTGEHGFVAMAIDWNLGSRAFVLDRVGNRAFWRWKNVGFTAVNNGAVRYAVERSFADSLVGAATFESLPHPETKAVLVDLGTFLFTDISNNQYWLEDTYRQPYKLDAKSSFFSRIRSYDMNVEIETTNHYLLARKTLDPLMPIGIPPMPAVPTPNNLMDYRSLQMRARFSIAALPEPGYRLRLGDDRIGHFFKQIRDYTSDTTFQPEVRYINRWRLEKKDPQAALSDPKKPIVFWIDQTVPTQYHKVIAEGVLSWNKAFEQIGIRGALEVKVMPQDAEWDAADIRYSVIRWMTDTDMQFIATGATQDNPFTGETLKASITLSDNGLRAVRTQKTERSVPVSNRGQMNRCLMGAEHVSDHQLALMDFSVRGMDPGSPVVTEFLLAKLKETMAHEVGHTLGLTHNFRASTIRSIDEMLDKSRPGPRFGSVMDYPSWPFAARQFPSLVVFPTDIGPYDMLAVEYAYKFLDGAKTPEDERPQLNRIAVRTTQEPDLAFGDDVDASSGGGSEIPLDPDVVKWDMGKDPIEFARRQYANTLDLWKRMENEMLQPANGYQMLRNAFVASLSRRNLGADLLTHHIGGMKHRRVHFGDPGGKDPFEPVPAARQREALQEIERMLFRDGSFAFPQRVLNRLGIDHFGEFSMFGGPGRPDVAVTEIIRERHKETLDSLLHPIRLNRMRELELRSPSGAFRMSELFRRLDDAIWSEARGTATPITLIRRNLTREHLRKLTQLVLADGAAPEDARSLARASLERIGVWIRTAQGRPGLSTEAQAHWSESLDRIQQTLKAHAVRAAF